MAAQRLGRLLLLGLALGCVAATSQSSIFDSDPARTPVQKDATSTAPIFETTGSDPYTHITHAAYPNHHVRIKKSRFCDETVEAYTGYIDVDARHLFFYFFRSRRDWTRDDLVLWTTGGPGCSSALSLFMENGPCRITDERGPQPFEHSWNEVVNMVFIDQPVGTGFSYADHGETVGVTEDAAADIAAFLSIFTQHFSLEGRAVHLASTSYGGRYIPLFAAAILDRNPHLVRAGHSPLNLSSIMIGSGWTDSTTMTLAFYDMTCTPASLPPVLPISTCVRMKQALPRCERLLQECADRFDLMNCAAARAFCMSELSGPLVASGVNLYDLRKQCDGPIEDTQCYRETRHIAAYLSRPDVRVALGVNPPVPGSINVLLCNPDINARFHANLDDLRPTQHVVAALLERGLRTLIYSGDTDWAGNWVGNARWLDALEWSGAVAYANVSMREWAVFDRPAGRVRTAGPLTFATIHGAGHFAPYDKPEESLEMLRRWLAGDGL